MTITELVNETVAYYKNHERGVKHSSDGQEIGCHYITDTGDRCAVGRCFNDAGTEWLGKSSGDVYEIDSDINEIGNGYESSEIAYYMKDEYKDVDIGVWADLQHLHDNAAYWTKYKTKKGYALSKQGKNFINNKFGSYE